jgi:hypothetical protein
MMLLRLLSLFLTLLFSISTLSAKTIFVSSTGAHLPPFATWGNASTNLQDALTLALEGDEIWVAAGTYYPDDGKTNNDRNATFALPYGAALYGGFAGDETQLSAANPQTNETILSGDINGDNTSAGNSYHVVSVFFAPETSILQGFTIQDGNADNASTPNDRGGAIQAGKGVRTKYLQNKSVLQIFRPDPYSKLSRTG